MSASLIIHILTAWQTILLLVRKSLQVFGLGSKWITHSLSEYYKRLASSKVIFEDHTGKDLPKPDLNTTYVTCSQLLASLDVHLKKGQYQMKFLTEKHALYYLAMQTLNVMNFNYHYTIMPTSFLNLYSSMDFFLFSP